jgi:tetratricopeptide (TPR) repeat protein
MIKKIQDLVQRRKWDKIRKGYADLIEKNPKDTRSRLKLGDLYSKQGKISKAVEQYTETAEIFAKAGFHLKSIALFKQILKVQPQSIPALRRAAQISYQYGLYADAYPYYESLAKILRSEEQQEKLWEIFQELSHLPLKETKQKVRVFEAIFPEHGASFADPFERLCQVTKEMGGEERSRGGAVSLGRWITSFWPDEWEGHELLLSLLQASGQRVELQEALKKLEALYEKKNLLKEKEALLQQYREASGWAGPAGGDLDEQRAGPSAEAATEQVKVKMEANIYDLLKKKSLQEQAKGARASQDGEAGVPEGSPLERLEFQDLFDNFKQGIQGQVARDDYETHYNLGVAYNEMGLYEDAIEELQIASSDPALQYDAFFLMGSCARDLDRPEIALDCYEKVLMTEGLDQEQRRGIRYEQALTLRSAGQNEEALQIFQEILEEASDYRDTEQQIQELMQASGS